MPTISAHLLQQLQAHDQRLRAAFAADRSIGAALTGFWNYLQASETILMAALDSQPAPPGLHGSAEWGLALYLLNDLPLLLRETLTFLGMPSAAITTADLERWEAAVAGPGIVGGDGTLYAFSKYAQLDPDWVFSAYLYAVYRTIESPHAFPGNDPAVVKLSGTGSLTLALFGDWGTGIWRDASQPQCPSQLVMDQIQKLNPDIAVHLGDVYYAGTQPGIFDYGSNEEQKNLIDQWPAAPVFPKGSFTLNSNHEMYDGANGLFNVALANPIFAPQNGNSYFAIKWGGYLLLGLDSAYFDRSELYMDGALTDTAQIEFARKQSSAPDVKTIIVMTHHTGLTTDGTKRMALYDQVVSAIGRAPDYWYWGHIHNGIVYSAKSAADPATKCRCIGHAALPFGNAWELHDASGNNIPTVDYYTHTPLGSSDPNLANRVRNGFAVLTLTASGVVETWYDQEGNVAWTSAGTPAQST